VITSASSGVLTGTATYPSGAAFASISGTVSGLDVKIVTTYSGSAYVATFTGKLAADGGTMSGTWSAGEQTGTWTATRLGS
jgi:hypothetical protein